MGNGIWIDPDRLAALWRSGKPYAVMARELRVSVASLQERVYRRRQAGDDRFPPRPGVTLRGAARRSGEMRKRLRDRLLDAVPTALPEADARWLAAVLDAAGAIAEGPAESLVLDIHTTSRRLIAAVVLAAHCGTVTKRAGRKTRLAWRWKLLGIRPVQRLLGLIRPHMRVRGELVDLLLRWPTCEGGVTSPEVAATRATLRDAIAHWRATADLPAAKDADGRSP